MLEDGKKTSGQAQKNSRSISLCTAPTSTSFKTLIKSTRESQNKRKRLYSLKLPLCASQDMLRYLSTSASVAVVHDANITSVYVCTCVRVYAAVRWDCSIYAVMCHTWLWIHVSFFLPRAQQICVMHAWVWERVTGRHQRRFGGWWQRHDLWWRPPFCHRRLAQITPSAIFLLCMLMKQRGSNEKRVTDKKRRVKRETEG